MLFLKAAFGPIYCNVKQFDKFSKKFLDCITCPFASINCNKYLIEFKTFVLDTMDFTDLHCHSHRKSLDR